MNYTEYFHNKVKELNEKEKEPVQSEVSPLTEKVYIH